MCGIAGVVDPAGLDGDTLAPRLDAALQRLSHRGPDGSGTWSDARCMLGHRRLSIVDLSEAGRQPMLRGGLAVSFNGMIYNYRDLRQQLEERGERFSSDTDTEVILAGWCQYGPDLLLRLDGMFAFAIWDAGERQLWLARDRFGKKPLLWSKTPDGVVFASDLRALQQLMGTRGEIDPEALSAYLSLKYVPEPLSILKGVAKVAPGHVVRIDRDGAVSRRWYQAKPDDIAARLAPQDRAPYIRHLVEEAVQARMVADVPLGAFLSGGIDSAVVAAAAGPGVRTFTVGFEGVAAYYEERPQARETARHLGTEHVEIAVDAAEAIGAIDRVFDGLDEPFGDSSAVPAYIVSREIRRHATVALSGDGGDEVFGGYRRHQGELYAGRWSALPLGLRRGAKGLIDLMPESKDSWLSERLRRLRRFAAAASFSDAQRQAQWIRALDEAEVAGLAGSPAYDVADLVARWQRESGAASSIDKTLYADLNIVLPGDMLPKVDRMGMANALEVRSPLLDHRLVEAALAFPPEAKVAPGRGKAVLRDAFADRLPAGVLARPKKGFEIPVAQWLLGPLREMAEEAVTPSALAFMGLEESDLGRQWLSDLQAKRRDTAERVWVLLSLWQWMHRQQQPL
ncbi:asparagine synthetase B [Agaricicola taiwanensis]|uniref:asparagine synthase (glutamine-hydrolyzing) n=1 Tax=Agaricicola taiwanensis TaxID=591372 RepID=A0A8J2VL40_9RHOB|nr:asparagine synthase (glutamine-hydrolyzing) [Agaricicola taiwanensis]GGE35239.1 asparagine synthetase B [Agaricicola taiwanensis]